MVVTGGGKGVGRAIVARFVAGGHDVIALGRDRDALVASGAAATAVCDVTDEAQVNALFGQIGAVDVLVNNAGIASSAPLARTTLDDWREHLDVNATGVFLCTRAVIGGMIARGNGRIVTIASTAAKVGARYTAAYAASKHAAVGLMRVVAAEVAGTGVTANAVCPTWVRSDMTQRAVERIAAITGRHEDDARAELARQSPLGRLLEPEEVAFAVAFLAAPEAAAINGQTLVLDGGGVQS